MINIVKKSLESNIDVTSKIVNDENFLRKIENISEHIIETLNNGNTVFTCGNGGSMADALHFTAELVGRFRSNRTSLPSITLGTNASNISAIANDFGYNKVFSRELSGLASRGDILVFFSTSGNSDNIIEAIKVSQDLGIKVVAFLGEKLTDYEGSLDFTVHIPSTETPRIQELHTLIFHSICEIIDQRLSSP
ncbi:TPA: SIS domain-containing protein [Streptococcus suis]